MMATQHELQRHALAMRTNLAHRAHRCRIRRKEHAVLKQDAIHHIAWIKFHQGNVKTFTAALRAGSNTDAEVPGMCSCRAFFQYSRCSRTHYCAPRVDS